MVCVNQASHLMGLSYPAENGKSTAPEKPSQFVYKNGKICNFIHKMFKKIGH